MVGFFTWAAESNSSLSNFTPMDLRIICVVRFSTWAVESNSSFSNFTLT